ncbi:type II toxin-antitoxin system prevent-host-death family antitoxin [Streptomyces sp. NPDC017979]|uniref:type II toxin-antitoxin system prevent-host-death family antitoxin n=1 Tax=Streptomyces sp. NPDC017979 TaxID=3365024 RepID=UPI003788D7FF
MRVHSTSSDRLGIRETRAQLSDVLNKAAAGEATIVTRNGEAVAAVIPMDGYHALEDADIKRLAGHDDLYRLRVGDDRLAYAVCDGELVVLVVKVGHRRDVCRAQ